MVKLREWSGGEPQEVVKVSHAGLGDGRVRLAYGMRPDGTMAHIKLVANGRACGCVCSACKRELVAYHPERIAHHFKHAANLKRECKYARESAMHRYAKQLLEREKRLLLTGLDVEVDGYSRTVIKEGIFVFDTVRLEEHLVDIVPDVILTKGDRELYVEISVTHPCDAEKIQKIERRGISTLEIDLSGYAYSDNQAEVDDIILHKAPRRWVYHRNEESIRIKLQGDIEARKAVEAEKYRRMVLKGLQGWVPQNANDWRNSAYVRNCIEADLEEYIGHPIEGDQCFRMSPRLWQAMLLAGRIVPHKPYASRHNGINLFKAGLWLAENRAIQHGLLVAPNAEDLAILKMERPHYRPPIEIILQYVRFLEKHKLVHMPRSFPMICVISDELTFRVENAVQERKQKKANAEYLNDAIRKLTPFVMNEYPLFSFAEWKMVIQDRFDASFAQALEDTSLFQRMARKLEAVVEMVEERRTIAKNLLGLPLEQEAKVVSEQIEAAREKAAQQEMLMTNARIEATINYAEKWLKNGAIWVREKQEIFGGKSAAEYAAESADTLPRIEREVHRLRALQVNEDAELFHKEQVRRYYQNLLRAAVMSTIHEADRDLFLNTTRPELGMKPADYVVDEPTFSRVKTILMMLSTRNRRPMVSRRHRRF
ncbi:MAG: hypothetical protein ACK4FJ_12180 [Ferrovibrio sp.]|uniref:hypothetical protein n=1 Tax=Ferrovibrio sp. TaxID=1917215 RepID=UPI00391BA5DA